MAGQKAAETLLSAGNQPGFPSQVKRKSGNILAAGLNGHQNFLISGPKQRKPLRLECQLEVVDDPVDRLGVGDEGNDLNRAPALGTHHRSNS